jgi:hypothetical protein
MKAIVAGEDANELGESLAENGVTVTQIEIATRPELEEAGIVDSGLFVLTAAEQATGIAIAKDLNEDVRVVCYADDSIPDFARGQADLIVDPELLGVDAVAEELVAEE